MEGIFTTLLPYFFPALSLAGCLWLYLATEGRLRSIERKVRESDGGWKALREDAAASAGSLESQNKELRRALEELSERIQLLTPSLGPRAGMSLNKRSQVLRLARQGELPEQIAAALGLPQNEVDLLLKVHRAVVKAF